jgi:hypothetical protein|tara:strand:- start:173 stop:406 length:234 start_codon:yes stop_codon:yes gene_type:complete
VDAKRLLPILGSKILSKSALNRGVEILLNGGKRKPEPPKTFQVKFGKMVRFLKRELHLYLEFSLDIKKDDPEEDEKC